MTSSRESSLCMTPTSSSVSGQIPKFGTLIPNRVFVGGISSDTSENELKNFFSAYGPVKDCKIILDRGGISKSYGFVTFEQQEDAERIIKKEGDNLIFKDRKLNVGPAIRKQQAFPKVCEPTLPQASYVYHNGLTYAVPNGMTVLCHPEGYMMQTQQQQQPNYQMVVSPSSYMPQQGYFHSPPAPAAAPTHWNPQAQWRWATQNSGAQPMQTIPYIYPMQTILSPEMMYAQTAAQSCQTADYVDAGMVDPSTAEYSYTMGPSIREQHFAKVNTRNQFCMY